MTYTDPNIPPPERRVEIRERGGTAGWVVAGMIAIVAVIAVGFMVMKPTAPDQNQITAAQEQGRQAGLVEGAQGAAMSAQNAAQNVANDSRATADQARAETAQAARSAAQSAQDAADRVASSPNDQAASPDNPPRVDTQPQ